MHGSHLHTRQAQDKGICCNANGSWGGFGIQTHFVESRKFLAGVWMKKGFLNLQYNTLLPRVSPRASLAHHQKKPLPWTLAAPS